MSICENCRHQFSCVVTPLIGSELYPQYRDVLVEEYSVEEGQAVFREGEPNSSIYLVKSGSVKISRVINEDEEGILGFGFSWRILGFESVGQGRHVYSVIALEKVRICRLDYPKLLSLMFSSQELHARFIELTMNQIVEDSNLWMATYNGCVQKRAAAFLLFLAKKNSYSGSISREIHLPMPRCDISKYLGVSVESLSRGLSSLSKRGVIDVYNRRVDILDVEGIQDIALGNEVKKARLNYVDLGARQRDFFVS